MTVFDPYKITFRKPNHLSFGGLDRDVLNREREDFVDLVLKNSITRILPVWRSKNLFSDTGKTGSSPMYAYLSPKEASDLIKIANIHVYLGKQMGRDTEIPYLAIDISSLNEAQAFKKLVSWGKFRDLREISPIIGGIEGSILAYAKAMIYWNYRNGFCSVCGAKNISTKAGHQRNCSNQECGNLHFPRTDPAVIMLVQDGEKSLLGRQKVWPDGLYSTLAGFVEPGETIEHAVAREVFEEAGIIVKNITYQYSQPWPFPSSLMLGFKAVAQTNNINCNYSEIEDAQWFTREEVLNFEKQGKSLPRKLSVSRRLIEDWISSNA